VQFFIFHYIENDKVVFITKDYRNGARKYPVSLTQEKFIRRFSIHILPKGFPKIRYYGIMSHLLKNKIIPLLQQQPGKVDLPESIKTIKFRQCPVYNKGELVTLIFF